MVRNALHDMGQDPEYITDRMITEWLANPDYSPWTRCSYHAHLRSYFRWLIDTEQLDHDPMLRLRSPRSPKDKPRPLTPAEAEAALTHATGHVRVWLLLGLLAGLRSHEVAKLRGADVTEQSIYVVGKGNKMAFIPTHPTLWELVDDYPRSGWWFPSRTGAQSPHIASTWVTTAVTKHFSALGIEGSFHRCRHSYGTNLLRSGVNIRIVQTLMRHDSLATTAKYTAVDEDERADAIRRLVA